MSRVLWIRKINACFLHSYKDSADEHLVLGGFVDWRGYIANLTMQIIYTYWWSLHSVLWIPLVLYSVKWTTTTKKNPWVSLRAGLLLGLYPGPLYCWPYRSIPFLSLKKDLSTLASLGGQTLIALWGQSVWLALLNILVSGLSPAATQQMMNLRFWLIIPQAQANEK